MDRAQITTISLPRTMVRQAKQLAEAEERSVSEVFREAWRAYAATRLRQGAPRPEWQTLRRRLLRVSRAGKSSSLSAFVAHDRRYH